MSFADRRDAGRRLAAQLRGRAGARPVVLALPGGGVPVAVEVATALGAPLELLAVGTITAPGLPHLVVGAIAEDGSAVVNSGMARRIGMTDLQLRDTRRLEGARLRMRALRLRGHRAALDLRGRDAIIVDDGFVTGLPAVAAVRAARRRGAARVIVAAPLASPDAFALLGTEADEVVCPSIPERLGDVGAWYGDVAPVGDEEIAPLLAEHAGPADGTGTRDVTVDAGGVQLPARLTLVRGAIGAVVVAARPADGPRDATLARCLAAAGFATLTADLLTDAESRDRAALFDIPLLTARLSALAGWVLEDRATRALPLGLVGASTSAAAALRTAARLPDDVRAVVSCGGRPDLAGERIAAVRAATLLVVGGADREILHLNRRAEGVLRCPQRLEVVPGARHDFAGDEATGALAALAEEWFAAHLPAAAAAPR
jgi:putative phosphoribosyl transferase